MSINNKILRAEAKEVLVDVILGALNKLECVKSCVNCIYFNEKIEHCTKWNARPPARTIAFGCESYQDDLEIPY